MFNGMFGTVTLFLCIFSLSITSPVQSVAALVKRNFRYWRNSHRYFPI